MMSQHDHSHVKCMEIPQSRVAPEELGLGGIATRREAKNTEQYVAVRMGALSELASVKTAQATTVALAVVLHDRLESKPLRTSQQRAKAIGLSRWQWGRAIQHLPEQYFTVTKECGKPTAVGLTDAGQRLFHPKSR